MASLILVTSDYLPFLFLPCEELIFRQMDYQFVDKECTLKIVIFAVIVDKFGNLCSLGVKTFKRISSKMVLS